jgi:hypothetical protein
VSFCAQALGFSRDGLSQAPGGPGCLPLGESMGRNTITFDHIGGAITAIFQECCAAHVLLST